MLQTCLMSLIRNLSGFSVLQFIRGIPLGLVFVAFVLPLFVISCPKLDTVIGEFSAYQSLDLTTAMAKLLSQLPANEINDVKEAMGNFSMAVFSVLVISALSFGFSFFQRILAAILGIVALVDFSVILVILVDKSNEMISIYPGSGSLLSIGLFIVAIVMCFIPCKRERSLPLIAKIALVLVPVGIVFVCAFPGIGASNSFEDGRDGRMYKTVAADKGLFDKEFPRKETLYLTEDYSIAPASFNPLADPWMTSWPIGNDNNLVYETLVSFNSLTRELEPLLGAINETLSNNDSVVVNLNPAARWSDGRTVSSDDVLFTFLKSPKVSAQRVIKDIHVKENAKKGDQISFIVNKNEYANPLMVKTLLQTVKIVPSHIFAPLMETYGAEKLKMMPLMDEKLVSSGPYTIESVSDKKIALVRRDDYWGNKALHDGDKPAPKYIVQPILSSSDENTSLLRKGAVDISHGWVDVRKLKQDGVGTWLDHSPFFTPATVVTLVVNATKTPLENKVFRRALAASIDYLMLSDACVMGYSPKVFPGLVIPYGYEKKFFNVGDFKKYGVKFGGNKMVRNKNVREMLSSIGITSVWDGDSLLYMEENGRRLPTLYITTPAGWSDWETMVDVAVDGMRSAGIDVRKNLVDGGEYWPALGLGNFDLIMHKPAPNVNPSQLWSRFAEIMSSRNWTPLGEWAGMNLGRYNNPEANGYRSDVDKLLSSIPFMNDSLEIKKAYGELNKIFMEDQPAIPLVYMPEQFYEFNSRVWTNWPTVNNPSAPPRVPGHGSSTNMLWNLELRR